MPNHLDFDYDFHYSYFTRIYSSCWVLHFIQIDQSFPRLNVDWQGTDYAGHCFFIRFCSNFCWAVMFLRFWPSKLHWCWFSLFPQLPTNRHYCFPVLVLWVLRVSLCLKLHLTANLRRFELQLRKTTGALFFLIHRYLPYLGGPYDFHSTMRYFLYITVIFQIYSSQHRQEYDHQAVLLYFFFAFTVVL
jgi:hypothetical protein